MALKTVVDLRERQREEAALALAAQRRRRDAQARELEHAVAQRDSIPTSAMNADDLDLLDRAARAAERRIVTAKQDLVTCEQSVVTHADEHLLRSAQHQSLLRITERRAEEARAVERRREQRTSDDLAGRPVARWL